MLSLVTAFHAKKPQELQEKLQEAIGVRPAHAEPFKPGLATLADMVGVPKMAKRIRRRNRSRELARIHSKEARA